MVFGDQAEVLTAIKTDSRVYHLLDFMTLTADNHSKSYRTTTPKFEEKERPIALKFGIQSSPPIEAIFHYSGWLMGFALKLDNGIVHMWGRKDGSDSGWQVLEGPIIGYHNKIYDRWGY